MKKNKQQGFTIIELLVATTIFSIVLMVILASFLQIGRMFYKGISINNTNEASRALVDDITSDIKLAQSITTPQQFTSSEGTAYYFCVGSHQYIINSSDAANHHTVNAVDINGPNPAQPHGIIRATVPSGCQTPSSASTNPEQLLGPNMQINLDPTKNGSDFISCTNTSDGYCTIHAHIVFYGIDQTVFDTYMDTYKNTTSQPDKASSAPDAYCSGSLLSTQFCAMTDLSAIAGLRQ